MGSIHINKIESFQHYSNFTSLQDFNSQIEMFLAVHKREFTAKEFILFRRLTKYCAKVYGVSNASIRTILDAAKKHDLDGQEVSESTFHRMKRKAVRMGVLESKETKRADGSQSANLWIFKRFTKEIKNGGTPCKSESEREALINQRFQKQKKTPHKTDKHLKTNIQITSTEAELDHTYVPEDVDKSFIDTVRVFFYKAQDIYGLWQLALTAHKESELTNSIYEMRETVNKAFRTAVFFHKKGKIKKSFKSYFYAVLKDYFNVVFRENLFKNNDLYVDWLHQEEECFAG